MADPAGSITGADGRRRCAWAGTDPDYVAYHDCEWGVPVHDERRHFEFLILEGAQAGLSWFTILAKRENYRQAYDGFDPAVVAGYDEAKIGRLLTNRGIVRNKRKVRSSVRNAQAFLDVQQAFGSFDAYIWSWVEGKTIVNGPRSMDEIPAATDLSERISKDLKARGFSFVGPTIMYAHLQAIGIVNDHVVDCFRYRELTGGPG